MKQIGHHALIIEDEPIFAGMLSRILASVGLDATTTDNGDDAQELIRTKSFDLVLLDLKLPDQAGPILAEDLEAHPSLSKRTLIVTNFPIVGRMFTTTLPIVDKTDLRKVRDAILVTLGTATAH